MHCSNQLTLNASVQRVKQGGDSRTVVKVMERDVDDAGSRRDVDDVTVDDVTLTSSLSSKFLRELKVVSGLAWSTVIVSHAYSSAPSGHARSHRPV